MVFFVRELLVVACTESSAAERTGSSIFMVLCPYVLELPMGMVHKLLFNVTPKFNIVNLCSLSSSYCKPKAVRENIWSTSSERKASS